jgi:hypothetical protein
MDFATILIVQVQDNVDIGKLVIGLRKAHF